MLKCRLCKFVVVSVCDMGWINIKLRCPHPISKQKKSYISGVPLVKVWKQGKTHVLPFGPSSSSSQPYLLVIRVESLVVSFDKITTFRFRDGRQIFIPKLKLKWTRCKEIVGERKIDPAAPPWRTMLPGRGGMRHLDRRNGAR